MCDKCVELDARIAHYERLSSGISDRMTLKGIKILMDQLKAQKDMLHPEQKSEPPHGGARQL
jgi:hypothetical protein